MGGAILATAYAKTADLRIVEAARRGDAKAVKELLAQHVDVNSAQPDGQTALAWAAYKSSPEIVAALIEAGANVNAANDYGENPLTLACANADAGIAEQLLKAKADPNAVRWDGETALMIAANAGSLDIVKMLLANGADVNKAEERKGQTALMWSAAQGASKITRELVNHGADVNAVSKGGFTALMFAAQKGDLESTKALLAAKADVNRGLKDGTDALLIAAAFARGPVARALLDNGATPNVKDKTGNTPLHAAAQSGDVELVKALLAHQADPNALLEPSPAQGGGGFFRQSTGKATPYFMAARAGQAEVMRVLAGAGSDTKRTTDDGTTALMAAAVTGKLAPVQTALELSDGIEAVSQSGQTVMHAAAFGPVGSQILEVIQFLADKGAKLDVKDKRGRTPLQITELRTVDNASDLIKKLIAERKSEAKAPSQ